MRSNGILRILNRNGRYIGLNHGSKSVSEDGVEFVEMEKRSRDRALSICRDYIGKTPRFDLIKQLSNIGEHSSLSFDFVEAAEVPNKKCIRCPETVAYSSTRL